MKLRPKTPSGELIDRGIRVNVISPAPTATLLYGKLRMSQTDVKARAKDVRRQIPAGRFGDATEVAKTVIFVASDESAGGELLVDGGMSNL